MSTVVLRNTKGSALTFTELDNNFSNLNSDKLEAVVSDTSPQLGGNLDVNGNSIVSTSAGNISITPDTTGKIILDGLSWPTADGTANYFLKTDGAGNLSWDQPTASVANINDVGDVVVTGTPADNEILAYDSVSGNWINQTATEAGITSATGAELENVVEDTTPQLGGDLDLNSSDITGTGNINITGNVVAQSAINAQTGTTYTPVLGDASKLITLSNASAITVTIPPNSSVAYPVGTKIDFAQIGAGQVTIAQGSGVTVNATPSLVFRAQYSGATCIKTATDTWLLVGDLETP